VLLLLFLLLIGIPVLEIYVIIQVSDAIGALPTVALLVATSLLGVRLVRSQGRRVVSNFRDAIAAGWPPAREALDGALVVTGGALLVAPGFVTDVFGATLLAPPTRALIRRWIVHHYSGRFMTFVAGGPRRGPWGRGPGRPGGPGPWGRGRGRPGGPDFDVEGTAIDADSRELEP
jgi:UPF0716 protein FxsA